jgi:hypothetical protein
VLDCVTLTLLCCSSAALPSSDSFLRQLHLRSPYRPRRTPPKPTPLSLSSAIIAPSSSSSSSSSSTAAPFLKAGWENEAFPISPSAWPEARRTAGCVQKLARRVRVEVDNLNDQVPQENLRELRGWSQGRHAGRQGRRGRRPGPRRHQLRGRLGGREEAVNFTPHEFTHPFAPVVLHSPSPSASATSLSDHPTALPSNSTPSASPLDAKPRAMRVLSPGILLFTRGLHPLILPALRAIPYPTRVPPLSSACPCGALSADNNDLVLKTQNFGCAQREFALKCVAASQKT